MSERYDDPPQNQEELAIDAASSAAPEAPPCEIRLKQQIYLDSEYSPDPLIPDLIRKYPHDIGSRLAVITAKYLRDIGVYQENVDISALAGQLGRRSKDFDVRHNTDIDETLAIHAAALSGTFLALMEGKTEGENEKVSAERVRMALQAQKQFRQTLYMADILQSSSRKMKERWER